MLVSKLQRWAGVAAGGALVAGITLAVGHQSLAQQQRARAEASLVAAQAAAPQDAFAQAQPEVQQPPEAAQPQPGFPGQPGGPGPGFPFPMFGGGGAMAANQNHVYVLRGNTVYALDAGTLKVTAQSQLPGGPMMGPGGFGGGGAGPRFAPGRRFQPGAPGAQPAPAAPGGEQEPPAPEPSTR